MEENLAFSKPSTNPILVNEDLETSPISEVCEYEVQIAAATPKLPQSNSFSTSVPAHCLQSKTNLFPPPPTPAKTGPAGPTKEEFMNHRMNMIESSLIQSQRTSLLESRMNQANFKLELPSLSDYLALPPLEPSKPAGQYQLHHLGNLGPNHENSGQHQEQFQSNFGHHQVLHLGTHGQFQVVRSSHSPQNQRQHPSSHGQYQLQQPTNSGHYQLSKHQQVQDNTSSRQYHLQPTTMAGQNQQPSLFSMTSQNHQPGIHDQNQNLSTSQQPRKDSKVLVRKL